MRNKATKVLKEIEKENSFEKRVDKAMETTSNKQEKKNE